MATSEDESPPESFSPLPNKKNRRTVNPNFLFFCQIALLVVPITILYAGLYFMNVSSDVIVGVCGLIIVCFLIIFVVVRPFTLDKNPPMEDTVPLQSRNVQPKYHHSPGKRSPRFAKNRCQPVNDSCDCPTKTDQFQGYVTSMSRSESSETLLTVSTGNSTMSLTRMTFRNNYHMDSTNGNADMINSDAYQLERAYGEQFQDNASPRSLCNRNTIQRDRINRSRNVLLASDGHCLPHPQPPKSGRTYSVRSQQGSTGNCSPRRDFAQPCEFSRTKCEDFEDEEVASPMNMQSSPLRRQRTNSFTRYEEEIQLNESPIKVSQCGKQEIFEGSCVANNKLRRPHDNVSKAMGSRNLTFPEPRTNNQHGGTECGERVCFSCHPRPVNQRLPEHGSQEQDTTACPIFRNQSRLDETCRENATAECFSCRMKQSKQPQEIPPRDHNFISSPRGRRGYFEKDGKDIQPPTEPPPGKSGVLDESAEVCMPCKEKQTWAQDPSKRKRGFVCDQGGCSLTEEKCSPCRVPCGGDKRKHVHFEDNQDFTCRRGNPTSPGENPRSDTFPIHSCPNKSVAGRPVFIKLIPTSSKEGMFKLEHDLYGTHDALVYAVEPILKSDPVEDTSLATTSQGSAVVKVTFPDSTEDVNDQKTKISTFSSTNTLFIVDETQELNRQENQEMISKSGMQSSECRVNEGCTSGLDAVAETVTNVGITQEKFRPADSESILDFVLKGPFSQKSTSSTSKLSDPQLKAEQTDKKAVDNVTTGVGSSSTPCEKSSSSLSFNLLTLDMQKLQLSKPVKSLRRIRGHGSKRESSSCVDPTPFGKASMNINARDKPLKFQPERLGLLVTESSKEEILFEASDLVLPHKGKKRLESHLVMESEEYQNDKSQAVVSPKKPGVLAERPSIQKKEKEHAPTEFKQIKKSRVGKNPSPVKAQRGDCKNTEQIRRGNFPLFPPPILDFPRAHKSPGDRAPTQRGSKAPDLESKNPDYGRRKRLRVDRGEEKLFLDDSPDRGRRNQETGKPEKIKNHRLSHQVEAMFLRKSSNSYDDVVIEKIVKQQKKMLCKFKNET